MEAWHAANDTLPACAAMKITDLTLEEFIEVVRNIVRAELERQRRVNKAETTKRIQAALKKQSGESGNRTPRGD